MRTVVAAIAAAALLLAAACGGNGDGSGSGTPEAGGATTEAATTPAEATADAATTPAEATTETATTAQPKRRLRPRRRRRRAVQLTRSRVDRPRPCGRFSRRRMIRTEPGRRRLRFATATIPACGSRPPEYLDPLTARSACGRPWSSGLKAPIAARNVFRAWGYSRALDGWDPRHPDGAPVRFAPSAQAGPYGRSGRNCSHSSRVSVRLAILHARCFQEAGSRSQMAPSPLPWVRSR